MGAATPPFPRRGIRRIAGRRAGRGWSRVTGNSACSAHLAESRLNCRPANPEFVIEGAQRRMGHAASTRESGLTPWLVHPKTNTIPTRQNLKNGPAVSDTNAVLRNQKNGDVQIPTALVGRRFASYGAYFSALLTLRARMCS